MSTARLKSDLWDALGGALPEGADRDAEYGTYVAVAEIAQLIESAAA